MKTPIANSGRGLFLLVGGAGGQGGGGLGFQLRRGGFGAALERIRSISKRGVVWEI